jgi:peroxiredoxin
MTRTCWALLAAAALGCYQEPPPFKPGGSVFPRGPGYGTDAAFKDDAQTNADVAPDQLRLTFVDREGKPVALDEFRGQKHVVLCVMRGYPGFVCPNCAAQTSRLIVHHAEFVRRGAEVLVVYPGPREALAEFVERTRPLAGHAAVPFRLLLDPDFAAVDRLGIRADLAKPSTYILDKEGRVRFAYVGSSTADRPTVKAMLDQLDRVNSE